MLCSALNGFCFSKHHHCPPQPQGCPGPSLPVAAASSLTASNQLFLHNQPTSALASEVQPECLTLQQPTRREVTLSHSHTSKMIVWKAELIISLINFSHCCCHTWVKPKLLACHKTCLSKSHHHQSRPLEQAVHQTVYIREPWCHYCLRILWMQRDPV